MIRSADQKAAFCVTAYAALLSFSVSTNSLFWVDFNFYTLEILAMIGDVFLVLGIFAGVWAVIPRTPVVSDGLFYFGSVSVFKEPGAYFSAIAEIDETDLLAQLGNQCASIAEVAKRKFMAVRASFLCGSIGSGAFLLSYGLTS